MQPILLQQANALNDPSLPQISRLSNLLSLLFHSSPDINWAGIYYYSENDQKAYLGPFQGKVACTVIPVQKGMVGKAIRKASPLRINDVHQQPDHIACDQQSASELVIPLYQDGQLKGVLDIDASVKDFFSEKDQTVLEDFASILESCAFCCLEFQ